MPVQSPQRNDSQGSNSLTKTRCLPSLNSAPITKTLISALKPLAIRIFETEVGTR